MRSTWPIWGAESSNTRRALRARWWTAWRCYPRQPTSSRTGRPRGPPPIKNGVQAVASGYADVVLVAGGEKMREVTGWRATDFVATLTHPRVEYPYGITLPGMAGMFTRLYMERYGLTREMLVAVAIKNQEMGALNPYAHVEMLITKEGILDSPHSVVNNPHGR